MMKDMNYEYGYVVVLYAEDVRELCVEKHFYTQGNSDDYNSMLSKCGIGLEPIDVVNIAKDILAHTDPSNEWIASYEALDEIICYLEQLLTTKIYIRTTTPTGSIVTLRPNETSLM